MNKIQAIETTYKGCRFRSRLEARWAVFFDACGIKWEYEPEGYEINGEKYLPDFYLPELETHAEVKGQRPGYEDEIIRTQKFIVWGGPIKQIVFLSDIPDPTELGMPHFPAYYWSVKGVLPGWYFFQDESGNEGVLGHISSANYRRPYIKDFDKEHNRFSINAENDINLRMFGKSLADRKDVRWDDWMKHCNNLTFSAYKAARSARFEHGENGAVI